MANHEIVPASAFTNGTAERRKSATSLSLPDFACSGTYSANLVITFSCFDKGHEAPRPATQLARFSRHPSRIEVAGSLFRLPIAKLVQLYASAYDADGRLESSGTNDPLRDTAARHSTAAESGTTK